MSVPRLSAVLRNRTSPPLVSPPQNAPSPAATSSLEIAKHIVDIKGAIDRLKEQVQNVE